MKNTQPQTIHHQNHYRHDCSFRHDHILIEQLSFMYLCNDTFLWWDGEQYCLLQWNGEQFVHIQEQKKSAESTTEKETNDDVRTEIPAENIKRLPVEDLKKIGHRDLAEISKSGSLLLPHGKKSFFLSATGSKKLPVKKSQVKPKTNPPVPTKKDYKSPTKKLLAFFVQSETNGKANAWKLKNSSN